jgi:hypothetical protein
MVNHPSEQTAKADLLYKKYEGKEEDIMKKAVKKALALALVVAVAVSGAQIPVAAASSPTTGFVTPTVTIGATTETPAVEEATTETTTRQPSAQNNATASASTSTSTSSKENVVKTGNLHESGNATVTSVYKLKKTTVYRVPTKVTFNGVSFKVTNIGKAFFANGTNATRVVIPKTVKRINKQGFTGLAKTVKTITFNTTKAPQIAKNAFEGVNTKKITITVPKAMSAKQLEKFKKSLKAAGFKGTVKQRTK